MHTHMLQECHLTSWKWYEQVEHWCVCVCVWSLHASKCDRSIAVPGVGSVMACRARHPRSVPQTEICVHHSNMYAFIQQSYRGELSDAITQFTSRVLRHHRAHEAQAQSRGGGKV